MSTNDDQPPTGPAPAPPPPTVSSMVQCPHCWSWTADEDELHRHIAQTCPRSPERIAAQTAAEGRAPETPLWDQLIEQADPPLIALLGLSGREGRR